MNTHVRDNFLAVPHPIDVTTATLDINNTATQQTLYSVTIPANALGPNGYAIMEIIGDVLTNNISTSGLFSLVAGFGAPSIAWTHEFEDNPVRQNFRHVIFVVNRGSTSSQILRGEPGMTSGPNPTQAEITVDTTAGQSMYVLVDWATADTQNSYRRLWARTLVAKN